MAYLPQFRNDVFISYRHALDEGPSPWMKNIHEQLLLELRKLVGPVEIWLDKLGLRDGDEWRRAVRQELEAAAIFVGLFSMTYMESDECRSELDGFLGWLKKEGGRRRLISVFVHPVGQDAVPQAVKDHQYHEFYEPEPPPSTHFREFRPDADEAARGKFVTAVARLAQDLRDALTTIKGLAPGPARGTVFLARVKPELREVREQLRAGLLQRGCVVLPLHEYLWNAEEFPAQLADDLARADLCVHLVSRTGSSDPEAVPHARLQLEEAARVMKAHARPAPLVWIRPTQEQSLDPSTDELIDLIHEQLADQGTEYWEGSLEEFKTQIHDKLAALLAPAEAADPAAVAVVAEDGDLRATQPLGTFLAESLNLEPRRLHFSEAAPREPEAFAATLDRCSHAIVFWGAAPEEWVSRVLSLRPIVAKAQANRVCVYGAPPSTVEKETFHSARARLLLQPSGAINEGELRRFLGAGERP